MISSGSTLGQVDGQPSRIWVYLIDNAGTLELAASHKLFRDDELVSTTAEGGAGGADSATVMYSASARSSVPCRLIGYIDNTQTTAGTWASAGSQIQVLPRTPNAPTVQVFTSGSGTYYTPAGCRAIRVRMVGGGGGGCGSGTSGQGNGNDGTDSTFGASLTAGKGQGGQGQTGGQGGTSTGGDVNIQGGQGADRSVPTSSIPSRGPEGGQSFFGGGGASSEPNGGSSKAAKSNTGGGGGSPAPTATVTANAGGGAGGYLEKTIVNPAASYAYSVGASGGGGGAGSGGQAGGAGGSGIIIVEEYY